MKLFIHWSAIYFDGPIRGVGEIEDKLVYFLKKAEGGYKIFYLTDDDLDILEKEREKLEKIAGKNIYHDHRNSGEGPTERLNEWTLQEFYLPPIQQLLDIGSVEIINPLPHGFNEGLYK